jgi:tRNA pseudouridine32 synthase/23S rRNA pseudouridine746 synthase
VTALKTPLPIADGVGPSSQWLPAGPWKTVLHFLEGRFPQVDVATWITRMSRGEVVDEHGLRLNPGSPYREGACIYYYRELESETRIPFAEDVLYEDEHILVVDKPHYLPVVPAGRFLQETLLVRLRRQGKPESLVPIHRLDRDTAGIVLFSVNSKTRGYYASLFRERKVDKVYEALAPVPEPMSGIIFPLTRRSRIVRGEPFFRMKEVEGEANSETRIEVVKAAGRGDNTLYRLRPVTGKKHQLRLHLAALEIPVVNDKLYPTYVRELNNDDFSKPLKLLAKSIAFKDPVTGRERFFESTRRL